MVGMFVGGIHRFRYVCVERSARTFPEPVDNLVIVPGFARRLPLTQRLATIAFDTDQEQDAHWISPILKRRGQSIATILLVVHNHRLGSHHPSWF
jgi:hypothetical protein